MGKSRQKQLRRPGRPRERLVNRQESAARADELAKEEEAKHAN